MIDGTVRAVARMGTVVTVRVPAREAGDAARHRREEGIARALEWFSRVEGVCSRFDPNSEVRRLAEESPGSAVPVSSILYQAVEFALAVAEESGGAFDPTVGAAMEARGYHHDYRDGRSTKSGVRPDRGVSWRDVALDPEAGTITLARPLLLDLGAVAKGLALDMAARELAPLGDFTIDAGGDLFLGGSDPEGRPWSVGIRHPRAPGEMIAQLRASDLAVCTSGDYERPAADGSGHHIVDPREGAKRDAGLRSPAALASVSVAAPSALVADALATAAFVLGPSEGLALLERQEVDGLLVTPELDLIATEGMARRLRAGLEVDRSPAASGGFTAQRPEARSV